MARACSKAVFAETSSLSPSSTLPSGDGDIGDDFVLNFSVDRPANFALPVFYEIGPPSVRDYPSSLSVSRPDTNGFNSPAKIGTPRARLSGRT